jgi:hypothetical protein
MAAIGNSNPTLLDVVSRLGENGKVEKSIVEMLAESNEIIADATFLEANDGTSHKTTIRSGLPSVTWRKLNYGVQPSKSRTVQVKDSCGMLEAYAEVDKALADLNGNTADFRLSEDRAFLESMNISLADTLFYGDTTLNPERFMGLAPRFSLSTAENGSNVIKGDGAGSDNTSIWLVVWGPNTAHMIYPKGSKAGIQHRDLGEETLEDADGGKFQGYRSHYKMDPGLVVRDWRYIARGCNIDVSALTADAATGTKLIEMMVKMLEVVPNLNMGRAAFYCNRTVSTYLRLQMANKSNVHLSLGEAAGKKVLSFDGIPVRRCDAILNTEATVA